MRPRPPSGTPIFSSWPWAPADGDPGRPQSVRGQEVIERLRIRRDAPGSLVVLADGRYAVTGAHAAIGSRAAMSAWAQRRLRHADEDERGWLETVVAALAGDLRHFLTRRTAADLRAPLRSSSAELAPAAHGRLA